VTWGLRSQTGQHSRGQCRSGHTDAGAVGASVIVEARNFMLLVAVMPWCRCVLHVIGHRSHLVRIVFGIYGERLRFLCKMGFRNRQARCLGRRSVKGADFQALLDLSLILIL